MYNAVTANVLKSWNIIGFIIIRCKPICKIQYVPEFNKIQHYYEKTSTLCRLFFSSNQLFRF